MPAVRTTVRWDVDTDGIEEHVRSEIITGLFEAAADRIVEHARSQVPVRTGRLRDSIRRGRVTRTKRGPAVNVRAGADYAAAIEFGAGNTPEQPYLLPALYVGARQVTDE